LHGIKNVHADLDEVFKERDHETAGMIINKDVRFGFAGGADVFALLFLRAE
jgi:hypothetical protein